MGGTLRVRPAYLTLGITGLVLWLGPDFAAKVEYARTKARVEALRDGPADTPLKMASDAGVLLTQQVSPSVVHITSIVEAPFVDGRGRTGMREEISNGSGWVWDEDGHIVTNEHVIRGAKSIEVQLETGDIRRATVQGADPATDIAVLALNGSRLLPAERAAEAPPAGTMIFAFGSPLELKFSVSSGIVSGLGRTAGIRSGATPMFEDFLQIDAPINPGNSGGPVTDTLGRVVGMSTAVADQDTGPGVGLAIPIELIDRVVPDLIAYGRTAHAMLGVQFPRQVRADQAAFLEQVGLDRPAAPLQSVILGGPADRAGIRAGDLILSIDGRVTQNGSEVKGRLGSAKPGETITVEIFRPRTQETLLVEVVLGDARGLTIRR